VLRAYPRALTKRDLRVLGVLLECNTQIRQITALCAQAERESQISRCVELNLRTKGLEGSLGEAIRRMD